MTFGVTNLEELAAPKISSSKLWKICFPQLWEVCYGEAYRKDLLQTSSNLGKGWRSITPPIGYLRFVSLLIWFSCASLGMFGFLVRHPGNVWKNQDMVTKDVYSMHLSGLVCAGPRGVQVASRKEQKEGTLMLGLRILDPDLHTNYLYILSIWNGPM